MSLEHVELVVIGASAGAVEVLSAILPALPGELRVPIVIVVHLPAGKPSVLDEVFADKCRLKIKEVEDKEPLLPGCVFFAPPGYHVLVERDGLLSLDCDLPVNFSRPSIDVLFESAAHAYGPRVLAALLTGASRDGARGLLAVKQAGGVVVAQDPASASAPFMPSAGIEAATPDYVLAPAGITDLLSQLSPKQP